MSVYAIIYLLDMACIQTWFFPSKGIDALLVLSGLQNEKKCDRKEEKEFLRHICIRREKKEAYLEGACDYRKQSRSI